MGLRALSVLLIPILISFTFGCFSEKLFIRLEGSVDLSGEIAQNYIRFISANKQLSSQVMHIVRFSEFLMTNWINHHELCKLEKC